MVWKEHHFARELERQLVEIASIRKRMRHDPEVVERLDRLELSHRRLIQRLAALAESRRSQRQSASRHGDGSERPDRSVAEPTSKRDGGDRGLSRALRRFQSAVHDNLLHLVAHVSSESTIRTQGVSSAVEQTASARHPTVRLPRVDERCARCGKVLLSSVLGGADLVERDRRWYHRACAPRGRRCTRPGPLN